jgi:solute carrier family 25 (mitochondrial phosphate transporter), member 3
LYELFKTFYGYIVGPKIYLGYTGLVWVIASATAEFFADILYCPFESVKVRMQTAIPGTFPTDLSSAWSRIIDTEGKAGFYRGLSALWGRQIPYTIAKFFFFEKCVLLSYAFIWTDPRHTYSRATQLGISLLCGYTAGVLCAIISQPADTMVSKLNNAPANSGTTAYTICQEIGFSGLWRGLLVRIIMVGTLTGLQWWIYDSFKTFVGLQTSGGK